MSDRIISGIQPTGDLHLGNYFGAIKQQIELQDQFPGECFYFIANFHALTSVRDAKELRRSTNEIAIAYLSLGLEPEKACLFRQSDVPEVTELSWLLSCVTGMGLLQRAHSYKDKIQKGLTPNMGLFNYPILMAADILAYKSTIVPVGKDQVQHVEMTKDMAGYFNEAFGETFTMPEHRLSETPKVPGVDGQKMSKSYKNTIPVFGTEKEYKEAVSKVVTSSVEFGDPMPIENDNILKLLRLFFNDELMANMRTFYSTGKRIGEKFGYGHAKQILVQNIEEYFDEANEKREYYLKNPDIVEDILQKSAVRAREIARETLDEARKACGLS